ncbi:MAG: hypothetical protein WC544_02240 [Patescibacteria group bacterium]
MERVDVTERSVRHDAARRQADQRRQRNWRRKNGDRYHATQNTWRRNHKEKRRKQRQAYHERNRANPYNVRNQRVIWSDKEKRIILAKNRPSDRTLSRQLGRSIKAIQMQRYKCRG